MSEYKFCSKCGGRVKRTAKFCGHCGTSLRKKASEMTQKDVRPGEPAQITAETTAKGEKQERGKECPNCGIVNDVDAQFCKNCAALL